MGDVAARSKTVSTVVFESPFKVKLESVAHDDASPAKPDSQQATVSVTTQFSSISPGTELLAFTGQMPTDIATDEKFDGQSEVFTYPARYGYSAVGVVEHNAASTGPAPGTLVFAFREHTSSFCVPPDALHVVPHGIAPTDATFLPTVETALSLATDAALLPGERACVVGQGIIGLVVVAVLRRLHPFSKIVALDINETRRRLSLRHADAHAALDPRAPGLRADLAEAFGSDAGADVSIDVSGVGQGLDTAIALTRDYGRVVVGSWYGSKSVALVNLGGRFHRSHMQLVASQVSDIPTHLTARWTKQRRFSLAWELIRAIKPATRFPVSFFQPEQAQLAYESLSRGGDVVQALFKWTGAEERAAQ